MARKHLGQNFLFDPSILSRIIDAAGITSNDTVVEIGPGHGKMTRLLADVAREVIAIELDPFLYERLKDGVSGRNIELVHGDALKYPYENLGPFKVVANIPYYITTPIIFKLLESKNKLKSITLTIQREVAERIVSGPGTKDYGVLSVAIQYHCDPKLKFIIPKGAFKPAPKVDSAVIRMDVLDQPRVNVPDEKLFFRIVRAAFSQRRKTLSNSLKPVTKNIKELLHLAAIEPGRRAETLSIEEFAKLSKVVFDSANDNPSDE